MWILDPLSIATGGYIGIGPGLNDYCPLPLAIGSDGYIRFRVEETDPFGGGMGHGAVILERYPSDDVKETEQDKFFIALAIIAINEMYDY